MQLSMDVLESLASDASLEIKEVTGEIIQVLSSLRKHEPWSGLLIVTWSLGLYTWNLFIFH